MSKVAELMNDPQIIKIRNIVKEEFSKNQGHTFDHISRVWNNVLIISHDIPDVDMEVLILATLLHDIAKSKEYDGSGKKDHAVLGAEMAEKILVENGFDIDLIEKVKNSIKSHRYRTDEKAESLEAKILYDADKLDSLGAVGIARYYMIAGEYNQRIFSFEPIDKYILDNIDGGKKDGKIKDINKHTANLDFELRAKNVVDRLFTDKAKLMGKERYILMKKFFDDLKNEIPKEDRL